jgi:hypothetical protein
VLRPDAAIDGDFRTSAIFDSRCNIHLFRPYLWDCDNAGSDAGISVAVAEERKIMLEAMSSCN